MWCVLEFFASWSLCKLHVHYRNTCLYYSLPTYLVCRLLTLQISRIGIYYAVETVFTEEIFPQDLVGIKVCKYKA